MFKSEINKKLKEIVKNYKDDYARTCDRSRSAYIKTLRPGTPMPKDGTIYGDEEKAAFNDRCLAYRQQAREIMTEASKELRNKSTEAPSTEAVNSISLLTLRKNITEDEIGELLERYGDNPQAYKTINSIANENGIRAFGDHPVYEELANVDGLTHSLEKTLSLSNAEAGHASDGYLSFLTATIDTTFPTE